MLIRGRNVKGPPVFAALAVVIALGMILPNAAGLVQTGPPQSFTVNVEGIHGNPLSGVSIQGEMVTPPSMGGGFVTVFVGKTGANGQLLVQNLSKALQVSKAWVKYQGEKLASESTPDIQVFMTKMDSNGSVYFQQSTLKISTLGLIAGNSYGALATLNVHGKPTIQHVRHRNIQSATTDTNSIGKNLPGCLPGGCFEYWSICNNETFWPSSTGYGYIPVGEVHAESSGYADLSSTFLAASSNTVGVGVAFGFKDASFSPGGGIWNVGQSISAGVDSTQTVTPGHTTYLDMYGRAEGAFYQLWTFACGLGCGTGSYQFDAGIVSLEPNPTNGCWYYATPNAPSSSWESDISNHYSNAFCAQATGTGTGGSSPYYATDYTLKSDTLVNTFAQSDTSWMSFGLPIGLLLLLIPGVDIPTAILMGIAATFSYSTSTTSNSLATVSAGAYSGNELVLSAEIGTTSYSFSSGSGSIVLMDVTANSYVTSGGGGGGGCVLNGTEIALANGSFIPVQDLHPGMKTLSYDTINNTLIRSTVSQVTETNVNSIVEVNNAIYISGLPDQPVYVKLQNGTAEWKVLGDLNYTMSIYNALNNTWEPIKMMSIHSGNFSVYDVNVSRQFVGFEPREIFNDYIANGFLLDIKID